MANLNNMGIMGAHSYLFDNAANLEEHVFDAVRAQFNKEYIPADIQTERLKSGGLFSGTKEVVISVVRQGYPNYYIVTRPVGHYLYVSVFATNVYQTGKFDYFINATLQAYFEACNQCLQNALFSLGATESRAHFKGVSVESNDQS